MTNDYQLTPEESRCIMCGCTLTRKHNRDMCHACTRDFYED